MSDFEDSTITYTAVFSPFGGLSDIRSPGVDGPPVMPEDPYTYVVAAFQAPPSPDYVPDPEYPPSPEFVLEPETESFKTGESATTPPPHPAYCVTARMSIRPHTPISLPSYTEISRLMAIPAPPPSPLSPLSSPLPQIPSPPLPLLSPLPTDPTYEEAPLGYREAKLRWMAEREEILEADLPLRKRLFRDKRYHAHTARLIKGEAKASRMAWAQSMDANDAARSKVITLRTQVSAQQNEITNLRAADHRF
nr:hypothetical protein [Tanacetum cinerariifolium]